MSFIRSSQGSFNNNTSPPIIQQANLVHKAFDYLPFVEKLPLQIECMTCYDNIFILGTNCGRMLINEVKLNDSLANKIEAVFEKSISTTKKPILQLEAVKAFNILIAMFDSQLHVFDLSRYQLLYSIPKTKGCSMFSISISADHKLLRLCVSCKKKLQFYYTTLTSKNTSQFMELTSDLELNDLPKNLKFTKDNLVVFSLRKDYYYYHLPATGESITMTLGGMAKQPELKFSTGTRQIEPMCEKLHNEFFTVGVDENKTIVYDTKGRPYLEYPIIWSSSPSAVCSIGPYLIGVLPSLNLIEIMTIQPHSASIQLIDINNKDGSTPTTLPPPPPVSSSLTSSLFPSAVTAPVLAVTSTMSNLTGSLSSSFGTNFSSNSVNPADRLKILKSNGNSICYVATQSNVWCLIPIKINDQLEQILRYKHYDLGLNIIASQLYFNETTDNPFANSWAMSRKEKEVNKSAPMKANMLTPFFSLRKALVNEIDETINRKISNLNALDLFCRKKFYESLQLFQNMKTDPSHIIAFIPGLLPDAYRNKLKFDDLYPVFDAKELEDAIEKLIDYLQFKRNEYLKEAKSLNDSANFQITPLIENRPVLKTRAQILQIIDTTLLKCYLKTKENLVPFFLRRDNSFLHLDESERLLIQHNKISELTILYEKKEAHEKALNLLVTESTKTSSPLFGQKYLIDYMKKLGNKNVALIFKYAKCVIEADARNGVKIFMGDPVKVDQVLTRRAKQKDKSFARKRLSQPNILRGTILNGISKTSPTSSKSQSLLSNEIDIEDDEDDEQLKLLDHEQVFLFLKEKIEPNFLSINLVRVYLQYCIFVWNDKNNNLNNYLIDSYMKFIELSKQNQEAIITNLLNDSFISSFTNNHKQLLIYFLNETNNYDPLYALSKLDLDNYAEERAIVLGKLGKHHEALSIYVSILNDTDKAEAYCSYVYDNSNSVDSKEVYYQLLQIYLNSDYEEIRIGASMKLLNSHSNEIGSCRSLELLPADLMKCKNLCPFFENMLNRLSRKKHHIQIINRLMLSLQLTIHETKIICQKKMFTVTDEQMCKECNKRMGKSAMVRFPNGDLIHYGCSKSSVAFGAKRN